MENTADEQFLIAYLAERNVPCPLCAYNLRGLVSPRCPECGQAVQLSISLVEPVLKAWIALIVALLPAAGFGGVFIVGFTYVGLRYGVDLREFSHLHFSGAYFLLHLVGSVPASISAIVLRHRFQRLPRKYQNATAAVAWGLDVMTILVAWNGLR